MYEVYKNQYPDSTFNQETLKSRVRQTLEEIGTGRSDCKVEGGASIQPDSFLTKIKETDGHASRNVISLRNDVISRQPESTSTLPKSNPLPSSSSTIQAKQTTEFQEEQLEKVGAIAEEIKRSNDLAEGAMSERKKMDRLKLLRSLRDEDVISETEFKAEARNLL